MRTHVPDDVYLHGTGAVAQRALSIAIRSDIADATLARIVRREIAGLDAALPVEIGTMQGRLGALAAGPRFDTLVLLVFAGVGLLLAAVGLYGTVAYLVSQRTQEIGIRMSLGATPVEIARLMLSYSAKWTTAGGAVGVLASLGATRLLSSLLFRVSPRDPITLAGAALCLFVVALVATIGPALRAARIDPAIALRNN
jgi:ABC-type antimicrobial peptide transport system permease subunit